MYTSIKILCLTFFTMIFIYGCGNTDRDSSAPEGSTILVSKGDVCLSIVADEGLKAGEPITVTVIFDLCGDCFDIYSEMKCSASLDGNIITVESQAKYERDPPPESGCGAGCMVYKTQCEGPALAEGDYTIQHGEKKTMIVVSSEKVAGSCSPQLNLFNNN